MDTPVAPRLRLTRREREILSYIAQGMCSQQIADELLLSKNTIDNHRRNMLKKQRAKTCMELVRNSGPSYDLLS